eukprot:2620901-Rhodomonas_salina.1
MPVRYPKLSQPLKDAAHSQTHKHVCKRKLVRVAVGSVRSINGVARAVENMSDSFQSRVHALTKRNLVERLQWSRFVRHAPLVLGGTQSRGSTAEEGR